MIEQDCKDFISKKIYPFLGKNIDLVWEAIHTIIAASPYEWRWLEPWTEVAPEYRSDRINVHVDPFHTITRLTVG